MPTYSACKPNFNQVIYKTIYKECVIDKEHIFDYKVGKLYDYAEIMHWFDFNIFACLERLYAENYFGKVDMKTFKTTYENKDYFPNHPFHLLPLVRDKKKLEKIRQLIDNNVFCDKYGHIVSLRSFVKPKYNLGTRI